MYVKVENGQVVAFPYGFDLLRRDNPNISFPEPMPDERMADFGVFPVQPREVPQSFDPITQNIAQVDPVLENGQWIQQWLVTEATPEEVSQRTEGVADSVRAERDQKLAASDWTQLPDVNVDKQKWADYRQKLRDVTDQPGFPLNVIWPTV